MVGPTSSPTSSVELGPFWFWRGHALEIIGRLDATIDALGDDHLRLQPRARTARLDESRRRLPRRPRARRTVRRTRRARREPATRAVAHRPRHLLHDLRRRHRTGHRAGPASPPRPRQAAGLLYWAAWARLNGLTYTALLAPGTDETLRLADEVRHDAERTGSVVLRQQWLTAMALALRPVDPERVAGTASKTPSSSPPAPTSGKRWPSPSSFAVSCSSPAVATPTRRPRCGERSSATTTWATGEACSTCSPGVAGVADRTGRPETAAALLAGLRAARDEYGLPGSANERHAEQRIGEHLSHRAATATRWCSSPDLSTSRPPSISRSASSTRSPPTRARRSPEHRVRSGDHRGRDRSRPGAALRGVRRRDGPLPRRRRERRDRFAEPEDEHSWIFYARDGDRVVAATRMTWGDDGFSTRQIEQYQSAPFLAELPAEIMAVGERNTVLPSYRGTGVLDELFAYSGVVHRRVRPAAGVRLLRAAPAVHVPPDGSAHLRATQHQQPRGGLPHPARVVRPRRRRAARARPVDPGRRAPRVHRRRARPRRHRAQRGAHGVDDYWSEIRSTLDELDAQRFSVSTASPTTRRSAASPAAPSSSASG